MHSTGLRGRLWAVILLTTTSALAHNSLYNYIEVSELNPHFIQIEFTVHAAELTPEADPNATDLHWVETMSDAQIEDLLKRAEDFVADTYRCTFPETSRISFPDCSELRKLAGDPNAPRPGCIVGTVRLQRNPSNCTLRYSGSAQKRLMLVLTKPGAFPVVKDLAPGQTFEIPLR